MVNIFVDPETDVARECFAVVQTTRRQRTRFPESCVRIVDSQAHALAGANADRQEYPARVYGPSASSEGLRLFYLVQWLD